MRRLGLLVFALVLNACQDTGPALSSTEEHLITVSPTSKDFGSVQVASQSAAANFTITPSGLGETYDTINSITESCPDFSISAPGLPYDIYKTCISSCSGTTCNQLAYPTCYEYDFNSYDWSATFKPTVGGTVQCVVTINMASGTRTVSLSGTGTLPPKDIDVQPTAVGFGDVRVATSSTSVGVAVRNVGGQPMTVTGVSIAAPFSIMSGPTGAYGLGAGASQPYTITCTPPGTTTYNGYLTVTSDDPVTPTVRVALTCRGIDSSVGLSPSPATLSTTRVGESVQGSVAIVNSGAATMTLQSVSLTGTDMTLMSAPGPGTYGTGIVGSAVIKFGATDAGAQDGVLTVTYDGGQTRTVAVSANALATSMALSPDGDIDFGPVCSGQTKTQTFSVLANAEGPFKVTQLDGLTAPFTVTSPTLPASVQGNGASTLSFDVTAAPTVEGTQTSALTVTTDIPGSVARTLNLTVDALVAGVSPSPAALDFGSTIAMTTTIAQAVHLQNCSTAPVNVTSAAIEGTDASEFAIVVQPDSMTIGGNENVTWLVSLTSKSPGVKHAELVLAYDGGTARVPLDGEALGSGDGDPTDPGGAVDPRSYYTCSTGTGRTSWPLAIAFVVVIGRRRRRRR